MSLLCFIPHSNVHTSIFLPPFFSCIFFLDFNVFDTIYIPFFYICIAHTDRHCLRKKENSLKDEKEISQQSQQKI